MASTLSSPPSFEVPICCDSGAPMRARRRVRRWWAAPERLALVWEGGTLALALGLFLVLSLHQLGLPGLYHDEAVDVVPAMQLLLGQPVQAPREVVLPAGKARLPVMAMDYVGAVNAYAVLPFFALFGINVGALRLMTIAASGLTLVLSFALARRLFNRYVAGITVLLLAVSPSFIFWSRQGVHVTSIMTIFSTGALLLVLAWSDTRRTAWLIAAAFLLGLGFSAKILFVWWIAGLVALWLALGAWRRVARPTLVSLEAVARAAVGGGGEVAPAERPALPAPPPAYRSSRQ